MLDTIINLLLTTAALANIFIYQNPIAQNLISLWSIFVFIVGLVASAYIIFFEVKVPRPSKGSLISLWGLLLLGLANYAAGHYLTGLGFIFHFSFIQVAIIAGVDK